MIKDLTVSKGNSKLPDSTTIFNLPCFITCPGKTKECMVDCYARKAEIRFHKTVLPCRMRNLASTKKTSFADNLVIAIQKTKNKTFRYFESGDFYSQDLIDKSIKVANILPDVFFYAYTKSLHLFNFSNIPDNFRIIDSLNHKSSKHKAVVIRDNETKPKGFFVCPSSCKKCNYCFNPKTKNVLVAFPLH